MERRRHTGERREDWRRGGGGRRERSEDGRRKKGELEREDARWKKGELERAVIQSTGPGGAQLKRQVFGGGLDQRHLDRCAKVVRITSARLDF